jgi:hypothetical protein
MDWFWFIFVRHRQRFYRPPIHADEIGLTSDKYIPLNETVTHLPLLLSYEPMSMQVHAKKLK